MNTTVIMKRARIFLFVTLIVLAPKPSLGQVLRGRVVEAKGSAPIPGVTIRVLGVDSVPVAVGVADDSGRFVVEVPHPGEYRIELSRIGYALRLSKALRMDSAQVYELNNIQLATEPVPVAAVPVTGQSRVAALERNGFYARKKVGLGHYIDRAAIELRAPQQTSDLFAGVRGVTLASKPGGGYFIFLRGGLQNSIRASKACAPLVFVDGVPTDPSAMASPARSSVTSTVAAFDFDLIHPQDVEAIEVYRSPAEVPPQYGGAESGCGVILLWRRVGR